ncbi:unnamed protein product [Rotaria sp. Silwood1]|nr:unnamed protein product [Rotaria sp. Silwood1]CAF1688267.1 unnamed protein product [Rotaria sp. Silwood1]CAF3945820.1 unnamed protein product [Rotaria sp. Silwood1]CAF3989587.1 unnamed protein product [Rotaria sp. Silwood1]CAF5127304.1 unnamed protein product [Rotaria sp. Silwood1]
MPQRQGKRNGLRTNTTLRCNEFERKANRGDFIINKETGITLSLSKSKRWQMLDDEENSFPIRKTIPRHMESNNRPSLYRPASSHAGYFDDFDRARYYQTINSTRCDRKLEEEPIDSWIDLSFKKHEYPLQRQLYKNHATPCKACLRTGGVILFRGRGKKSSRKTKGMKSYHWKDWQDEFNL